MTLTEIQEKLERCFEKADIHTYELSFDKNEVAELLFYEDNFYLEGTKTPYTVDDFLSIKFYASPEFLKGTSDIDDNWIKIYFINGDYLILEPYSYSAFISGALYRNGYVLKAYSKLVNDPELGFQSAKEILDLISLCLDKSEIGIFTIQEDEDQVAEVGFTNNRLFINGIVETPYLVEDVATIKYFDGHRCGEDNRVIIGFKTGESLRLMESGHYEASILEGNLMHSYSDSATVTHKFALAAEARKRGIANEEFVVIDGTLIKYNGDSSEVYIPNGVLKIDNGIFEDANIKKIVFPSTLKEIGDYCFRGCKELSSVHLNEGLESIGDRAFCRCYSFSNIVLPESLKRIEECAFLYTNITSFQNIPDGCNISDKVFDVKPEYS